jgi:hypothetical protein
MEGHEGGGAGFRHDLGFLGNLCQETVGSFGVQHPPTNIMAQQQCSPANLSQHNGTSEQQWSGATLSQEGHRNNSNDKDRYWERPLQEDPQLGSGHLPQPTLAPTGMPGERPPTTAPPPPGTFAGCHCLFSHKLSTCTAVLYCKLSFQHHQIFAHSQIV